jgi:hypothetical protein
MSDSVVAFIVPAVMIAIIFAWGPLLNLIFPTCPRASGWQYLEDGTPEAQTPLLFESRINPADFGRESQVADR